MTRLPCGGFIFALRLNHAMSDATGSRPILDLGGRDTRRRIVPDLPTGVAAPPAQRDLPSVIRVHPEYDQVDGPPRPFHCALSSLRPCGSTSPTTSACPLSPSRSSPPSSGATRPLRCGPIRPRRSGTSASSTPIPGSTRRSSLGTMATPWPTPSR